jgi:hypothetical protein
MTSVEQHKLVYSKTGGVGCYCVRFERQAGLIKKNEKRTKNGSLLGPVTFFFFFTTHCYRGYCQPIAAAAAAEDDGYH